jgi:hypothetical protein
VVKRYLTEHALKRYRRRLRMPRATREQVQAVLDEGVLRSSAPAALAVAPSAENADRPPDGWVICGEAVFLMHRRADGALSATTCVRRHRLTREARRERAQMARAERDAALL